MTDNQAPLILLRQSVAKLDQYEKLALAAYLVGTSNPKFPGFSGPDDAEDDNYLTKACDLARNFPSATKIFFAIELLERHIDRDEFDEGDGLPDPSDYEEDDHYVETFRDRRLDQ